MNASVKSRPRVGWREKVETGLGFMLTLILFQKFEAAREEKRKERRYSYDDDCVVLLGGLCGGVVCLW